MANTITAEMSVAEVLRICPSARRILDEHGLKGCGGAHGPTESLGFFASVHQADVALLLAELNRELASPSPLAFAYRESIADYIYRRFLKAGIAVVLTVGALSLFQLALGHELLQPRMLPAIHAHAHAMIFGWIGLFVMGFAYQSFPRFKYTTLWRPGLANLSFYLMVAGIAARIAAELWQPAMSGLVLGAASALAEIAAVTLFLTIILRTARQSVEAPNRYERFIIGAFVWFLIQTVLDAGFFFANATAAGPGQLVHRIALFDAPLRDVQLLGFAALIIAGVSQRFVPVVYGLGAPARDRQRLIFLLIHASLILDVVSYVAMLTTGRLYFAGTLELAYILMLVWPVLLVRQLRILSRSTHPDRSWKFIRASYVWLLITMAMMPFFMIYSDLTGQAFSHAYWGAHRHAFTVGFVSLMIVGVGSRVVPILAGLDSSRITSLWGPFIMVNVGCAGRVVFQILTDFFPRVAYPLLGLTGFVEFGALAWWGVGLWRLMNVARKRPSPFVQIWTPVAAGQPGV